MILAALIALKLSFCLPPDVTHVPRPEIRERATTYPPVCRRRFSGKRDPFRALRNFHA
jgi:hypothetical protein